MADHQNVFQEADETARTVVRAQRELQTVRPTLDREQVIGRVTEGLAELKGHLDTIHGADLSQSALGVISVVQAERQYQAIKEQTAVMNAGQFAMWRQTPDGQAYLAWESSALSLLRLVDARDELFAIARRKDMAEQEGKRPMWEGRIAEPEYVPPKGDERGTMAAGCLFFVLAGWLLFEVVVGLFGFRGLMGNWAVFGIVVALFFASGFVVNMLSSPDEAQVSLARHEHRLAKEAVDKRNEASEKIYRQELSEWRAAARTRLGYDPESTAAVDWMDDTADRARVNRIREFASQGRFVFPAPESLPSLVVPRARKNLGATDTRASRWLAELQPDGASPGRSRADM